MLQEVDKLKRNHLEYLHLLDESVERRKKRLGAPIQKRVRVPEWWQLHPAFNPFKVGADRKLTMYAHAISEAIRNGTYVPRPALVREVPKPGGGVRRINVFQVPDSAVSTMVFRSLSEKNNSRLSAHAYAYRRDRTPHDAIYAIHGEWRDLKRVYVAEFDFSKFFDKIQHDAIWRIIDNGPFLTSPEERCVIGAFLKSRFAGFDDYRADSYETRGEGIPQGTSVSLFLANLVCWELDRELERLGVGFVRFADDTLVWSSDYQRIVESFAVIDRYSKAIGVPLNLRKSEGINLVTADGVGGEIAHKSHVDFLGYRISLASVAIKSANVQKAQRRISFLIYQNLVQPLKRNQFNRERIAGVVDRDYLVAVSQIRSYLYGGLSEDKLHAYINGASAGINFRGFMSYYPIVNDFDQLNSLDGWLLNVFANALRLRSRLWMERDGSVLPGPFDGWIDNLERMGTYRIGDSKYNLRVPRFSLIGRALQASVARRGIGATAHPASSYY